MSLAYPIPNALPVRLSPEPIPSCRICGVPVPSADLGEYDELGARCAECIEGEDL